MLFDDLKAIIERNFALNPTSEQQKVISRFAEFCFSPYANNLFLLKGYAGTGKTTLAKQLVVDYVFKKGYKLVASDFDVGVFEKQIGKREEEKTLFYLDDFLGANCLDVIANNRDSQIVNFIKRILRRENCRLVLTSRTNIIKEASNQSVKISESEIDNEPAYLTVVYQWGRGDCRGWRRWCYQEM